jgi:hypothetical protein
MTLKNFYFDHRRYRLKTAKKGFNKAFFFVASWAWALLLLALGAMLAAVFITVPAAAQKSKYAARLPWVGTVTSEINDEKRGDLVISLKIVASVTWKFDEARGVYTPTGSWTFEFRQKTIPAPNRGSGFTRTSSASGSIAPSDGYLAINSEDFSYSGVGETDAEVEAKIVFDNGFSQTVSNLEHIPWWGGQYLDVAKFKEGQALGREVEWTVKPAGSIDDSVSVQNFYGTMKVHWHFDGELPVPEAGLVADPGGPYSLLRGTTVTLDGSRSRPAKGRQIRSYQWKLTPTGCPDLGTPTELTGQRVTFKVLCSLRAELTVDDGAKTATKGVEVTISARPWKTKLTTDPALELKNFGFEPGNFTNGMNRCQKHPDPNENHYYHSRAGSMIDYENGTFWLERVADSGPFRGIWFVAKGEFDIPRVIMINQKLYPGGSVYKANAAKGPKQKNMVDRFRNSVEAHESLHSTLLERAVKTAADPAKAVECGMAKDRDALKERMNSILRDAFTRLNNATAEDKVKAEMRKIRKFSAGGRIYYPASGNMPAGYRDFPSFAELGDK